MRGLGLACLAVLAGCGDCSPDPLQFAERTVRVAARTVDFGKVHVGTSAERRVQLEQTGTARVQVRSVRVEGDPAFVAGHAEGSLLVVLRYVPARPGPAAATLVIDNDSDNEGRIRVELSAVAVPTPVCEDHNPCTTDAFDTAAESCTHARREGACDDLSACTEGDVCVDGVCRGVAVRCDDGSGCTRDACDPARGCVHLPDTEVCNDHDPCTSDSCDPRHGCSHPDAPDGTMCGAVESCTSVRLCVRGRCTAFPVPDGFPCDDGDFCSTSDTCQGGACRGMRSPLPPEVKAELNTFGAQGSMVVPLPGGPLVFSDRLFLPNTEHLLPTTLSVVRRGPDGLQVAGTTALPKEMPVGWFMPLSSTLFYGVQDSGHPCRGWLFEVTGAGSVETRAEIPNSACDYWNRIPRAAAVGPAMYRCVDRVSTDALEISDISDPAHPRVVSTVELDADCWDVRAAAAHGRVVVRVRRGDEPQLLWLDARSPLEPGPLQPVAGVEPGRLGHIDYGPAALALGYSRQAGYTGMTSIRLHDPVTYEFRGSIEMPLQVDRAAGLALAGSGLYTTVLKSDTGEARLARYSVADLARPVLTNERLIDAEGDVRVIAASDEVVVVQSSGRFGLRLFRADVDAGGTLPMLTGPAHGGALVVAVQDGSVFAADSRSARRIELPRGRGPTIAAGGFAWGHAALMRMSAPAPLDLAVFGDWWTADPQTVHLGPAVPWLDATEASTPGTGMTTWFEDGSARPSRVQDNVLWALSFAGQQGPQMMHFERYELGKPLPPPASLWPVHSLGIQTATAPEHVVLGLDRAQPQIVAALTRTGQAGELFVVRLMPSRVLQLLARGRGVRADRRIRSVAVAGSTVVTLEGVNRSIGDADSTLHLYSLDETAGTLTHAAGLPLPHANHLLRFDGRTALVSTATGLVFVEAAAGALRQTGELPTSQIPVSADVIDDRLVVGANSAVLMVTPPCPLPPP